MINCGMFCQKLSGNHINELCFCTHSGLARCWHYQSCSSQCSFVQSSFVMSSVAPLYEYFRLSLARANGRKTLFNTGMFCQNIWGNHMNGLCFCAHWLVFSVSVSAEISVSVCFSVSESLHLSVSAEILVQNRTENRNLLMYHKQ